MRIISQNGITDIPYDLYGVRQLKSDLSKIIAFTNGDEFLIMAEYSTEAKAKKAMEMLREQYTHMKRVECFSSSLGSNQLETLSHKEAELLGDEVQKLMCFQFPQDSEITE